MVQLYRISAARSDTPEFLSEVARFRRSRLDASGDPPNDKSQNKKEAEGVMGRCLHTSPDYRGLQLVCSYVPDAPATISLTPLTGEIAIVGCDINVVWFSARRILKSHEPFYYYLF